MTDIRVTRSALEAAVDVDGTPVVRVSRHALEVAIDLATTNPDVRVSRHALEVLASFDTPAPDPSEDLTMMWINLT